MKKRQKFYVSNLRSLTFLPVAIITITFAITTAWAATYYLDPNGNDSTGDGSLANPWQHLSYACSQVPANQGHIIHLKSGIFTETSQSVVPAGLNIEGEGPHKTIIKSTYNGWLISLESGTISSGNQELSNFKIDGQNRALDHGIFVRGRHNVKIHDIDFEEIDDVGLQIIAEYGPGEYGPSPSKYLRDIEVLNCNFRNCARDFSGYSGGCMQIGHLDGASIHDITINENRGYGIKYWEGGWFKGIELYNTSFTVPTNDSNWGADIGIELWNLYDDCEVYNNTCNTWFSFVHGNKGNGAKSLKCYGNDIIATRPDNPKEAIELHNMSDVELNNNYIERALHGVAIWMDPIEGGVSNILIHHNIFYLDSTIGSDGIYIAPRGNTVTDVEIYSNVFDSLSWGVQFYPSSTTISNVSIKNNIFLNIRDWQYGGYGYNFLFWVNNGCGVSNTIITHNCFFNHENGISTTWGSGSITGTTIIDNLIESPEINGTGNRPRPYYELTGSGSNLYDAGINVGLGYSGAAPDIGAFEYDGQDPSPPDPPTGLTIISN